MTTHEKIHRTLSTLADLIELDTAVSVADLQATIAAAETLPPLDARALLSITDAVTAVLRQSKRERSADVTAEIGHALNRAARSNDPTVPIDPFELQEPAATPEQPVHERALLGVAPPVPAVREESYSTGAVAVDVRAATPAVEAALASGRPIAELHLRPAEQAGVSQPDRVRAALEKASSVDWSVERGQLAWFPEIGTMSYEGPCTVRYEIDAAGVITSHRR